MLASTLTSKGQITIPAEVRKALNLKTGDRVMFEIKDHKAISAKTDPFDYRYLRALSQTLIEWNSPVDDESFNNL